MISKGWLVIIIAVTAAAIVVPISISVILTQQAAVEGNEMSIALTVNRAQYESSTRYVVEITLKNNQENEISTAEWHFKLKATNNTLYSCAGKTSTAIIPSALGKGAQATFSLIFDIPSTATPYSIVYTDSVGSSITETKEVSTEALVPSAEYSPGEVEIKVNWAKYGQHTVHAPGGDMYYTGYIINISFTNNDLPWGYNTYTGDFKAVWYNGSNCTPNTFVDKDPKYAWPYGIPQNTTANFTLIFDMPLQEVNPQKIVFSIIWGQITPKETYAEAIIPTITIEEGGE